MSNEFTNVGLSLLALASAIACIACDYADRRTGVYLFKPLTMLLLLAIAVQPATTTTAFYQTAIVAGLVFSLGGDVALMLPSDRFTAGLSSFLVAHLIYIAAFSGDAGFLASPGWAAPFAALAGAIYALLWPGLGRLRLPVLVYVLAIAVMGWQATSRWLSLRGVGAMFACLGAVLFMLSDAVLAWNRFRRPFRAAQALVLGTYFTAQWMIALSVGVGAASSDGESP